MDYQLETITSVCQNSPIGKLLPNALYVHRAYLGELDPLLQDYEKTASTLITESQEATLVKFSTNKLAISYLFYPDFATDPHPALVSSIVVNMDTLELKRWNYSQSRNPPVLHRKETFVGENHPLYEQFSYLTQSEIALGLLEQSHLTREREVPNAVSMGMKANTISLFMVL